MKKFIVLNKLHIKKLLSISLCLLLFLPLFNINNSLALQSEIEDIKVHYYQLDKNYRDKLSSDQEKFVASLMFDALDLASVEKSSELIHMIKKAESFEDYKAIVAKDYFDPDNINATDEEGLLELSKKVFENANIKMPKNHFIKRYSSINSPFDGDGWLCHFGDDLETSNSSNCYRLYFDSNLKKLISFNWKELPKGTYPVAW